MTSTDTIAPHSAGDADALSAIRRYAAFSDGDHGGNPAGVMIADLLTKAVSRAIFTGLIKQLDDFHAL